MIVDKYHPVNLFELVPNLTLEMEPELAELDRLLDDDELFRRVKADMGKRRPNSSRLGRRSTPVEVVLRMLVLRRLYDFSYEQTERHVSDSLVLRQFCRLGLERPPDDTTLIRWAGLIGAGTLERMGDRVVVLARSLRVTRGRKMRTDGTVVETNIHHPTDSSLLADGVRVLGRLLSRAKAELPEVPRRLFRNRSRSAKKLAREVVDAARRRGERAQEALRSAHERLIGVAQAALDQAGKARELLGEAQRSGLPSEKLEHYGGLLWRVVEQSRRRVLEAEQVKASEKVVSIFEEHTTIIRRGKAGKRTEFGRKVWLDEVEGGIISGYRVLEGNPSDEEQLAPALEHHERVFGKPPRLVAADRGVYSPENERECRERGVERACLPKRGKKSREREGHERQGWFRRGQRFRAGVEGRISVMKRRGFLGECRDKGEAGFDRWVGWGVLVANLGTIARTLATR